MLPLHPLLYPPGSLLTVCPVVRTWLCISSSLHWATLESSSPLPALFQKCGEQLTSILLIGGSSYCLPEPPQIDKPHVRCYLPDNNPRCPQPGLEELLSAKRGPMSSPLPFPMPSVACKLGAPYPVPPFHAHSAVDCVQQSTSRVCSMCLQSTNAKEEKDTPNPPSPPKKPFQGLEG